MALRFLQANLNHCARAQDLFTQSLAQWSIDLAVASEPYLVPDRNNWVGDLEDLVAIYAGGNPPIVSTRRGRGCVGVKVAGIVVVGVYFSPNRSLPEFEAYLDEVSAMVRWGRPLEVVVAGDLNAKSRAWGSSVSDSRGEALISWIAQHNLAPLNTGSTHTCVRMQGGSVVDITLASPALACRVQDWEVLTEVETLSDHRYIRFDILPSSAPPTSRNIAIPPEIGQMWSLRSLDRETAELAAIVGTWSHRMEDKCVDDGVQWVGGVLAHVSDCAMAKVRPSPRRSNRVYWWSDNLSQLRSACVLARRRYTRYRRRRPGWDESEERCLYTTYQEAKKTLR
ncbi:PREDICTED: uncharacterized protein LOC106123278, partial [Papilio xuthus]|uniref:Uncharacterized protein LOC106123278 n=1 Tax=Papilio xuthus TaxID=66420 RepID=A0AAJ6ZLH5_PAPXU